MAITLNDESFDQPVENRSVVVAFHTQLNKVAARFRCFTTP